MNVRSLSHFGNRGHGFAVLAGTLIVMTASQQAQAADRLVPSQYSTIQRAVDAAQNGDTVIVADGNWRLAGNTNLSFKGKAITVRSASGDPTKCSIDGGSSWGPCVSFTNGEGPGSVLRGFTLKNAASNRPTDPAITGGGIRCLNSSPTIADCILTNNRSTTNGGGIGCTNSSPTITSCQFDANTAAEDGGGIFADGNSRPSITDSTFTANTAKFGGAIANMSNRYVNGPADIVDGATIRNCTFYRNVAVWEGGAMFHRGVKVNYPVSHCAFYGNSATWGGAMSGYFAGLAVTNSVFSGNRASYRRKRDL